MDLIGKHVLMILSEAGAAVFFAFPAPASFDPARRWGIGDRGPVGAWAAAGPRAST
jgi:hypothetical protein